MRGVYTAHYDITGLATSKTLMYILAPATAALEILSVHVTNFNNNSAEQWIVSLHKISSGSPTGTAIVAQKHESLDSAAAASGFKANITAGEPTYDTNGPIDKQGVSNLAGYHYEPIPEERPVVGPGAAWGVRMLSTPTSTDVGVYVVFREIG